MFIVRLSLSNSQIGQLKSNPINYFLRLETAAEEVLVSFIFIFRAAGECMKTQGVNSRWTFNILSYTKLQLPTSINILFINHIFFMNNLIAQNWREGERDKEAARQRFCNSNARKKCKCWERYGDINIEINPLIKAYSCVSFVCLLPYIMFLYIF